jgi:hypothetical protein
VKPRLGDVLRRVLVGAGLVFAFVLIMLIIYPRYGWLYAGLLMLIVTIMLVRTYSMGYRYVCAHCGKVFKVPLPVDFLTFSGMGKNPDGTYHTWKSLTCPHCGQRTRAVAVRAEAVAGTDEAGGPPTSPSTPARPRPPQRRGGRKRR